MRHRPTILLLALVAVLAGPPAVAQDEPTVTSEPAGCEPLALENAPPDDPGLPSEPATSEPAAGPPVRLAGRWSRMARAPFGSEYEPAVWIGRRLLAFDHDSGRTALYSPTRNRWREMRPAPRRFDSTARSAWTGRELVVLQLDDRGRHITGAAYDPRKDRWRRIAPFATATDAGAELGLADAVSAGEHVVVADYSGRLAAYHPAGDCWVELGEVPAEPWVARLYVAGPKIVESRRFDEPLEVSALEPATMTWSGPVAGPLDEEAAQDGGTWVDGQLVYLTWDDRGAREVAGSDAVFEPESMTWLALEHACHTPASGTVAAGGLLMATNGRRALDGSTFECFELPRPPRRLNGTERFVWTGSQLLAWSGIRSLPEQPRRGGLRFTPTGR